MAIQRALAIEDRDLQRTSIITSRKEAHSDIDLTFEIKSTGEIYTKKDAAAVKQSVMNLISTNHYEKPFKPFYGANVRDLLFELADDFTSVDIRTRILRAISEYEPRAEIMDLIVDSRPDSNSLSLQIQFRIVNTEQIVTFTTVVSRLR